MSFSVSTTPILRIIMAQSRVVTKVHCGSVHVPVLKEMVVSIFIRIINKGTGLLNVAA